MSIKQQKDIRKFLEGEYTFDTAEQIYKKQEDSLMAMLETVKNESKSRYKTLKGLGVIRKVLRTSVEEANMKDGFKLKKSGNGNRSW